MNLKAAVLLCCLLLLVSACERGGEKAPATPDRATEVSEATLTQPRTTVTPESTRAAEATPRASPQPEPSSTAGPNARSDGLSFYFGASVDDFDRSLIQNAVRVTRELLGDDSGVEPSIAVFAYDSPTELAQAFSRYALAQSWRGEGMAERMSRTIAESSYRGFVINTGLAGWASMDATERLRVVAHEFVHVIQLERAGTDVADRTLSGANTEVPPAGPFWLLEGSAEVVSWLVIEELQLGNYADALLNYGAAARGGSLKLSGLENYFDFSRSGSEGVSLSVLATDYLLRSRSLAELFDFWNDVRRGASWETAFTRQFGLPPHFFYAAFAEYYETTWASFTP